MRKLLLIAGIAVLCLPMLFVAWLFMAVRLPSMDKTTMRMPGGLRSAVAQLVMQRAGYGKKSLPVVGRVLNLDPENAEAWHSRCLNSGNDHGLAKDLYACVQAVKWSDTPDNQSWLGSAQELAGDACAAEDSYTRAASASSSYASYAYVESMGRAALHCGHLPAGRAGFETALVLEEKELESGDNNEDELADIGRTMLTDREYLIVIYHRMHEDTLASQTCGEAHPGWKVCICDLDNTGKAVCRKGQ